MSKLARWFGTFAVCSLVLGAIPPAAADIAATSGAMIEIGSPVSFLDGVTESSTSIFILDEGVTVLPVPMDVNAFGPGPHDDSAVVLMTLPAGTPVHTYFVHFDPDGGVVALTGGVTFDPGEFIFGIQTHTPFLNFSDPIVGDPFATYPTGLLAFRAFEHLPGTDMVTIAGDLNSASFSLIAELGVDQARIFTLPVVVPVPPAALLFGSALGLLAVVRRRPRRRLA